MAGYYTSQDATSVTRPFFLPPPESPPALRVSGGVLPAYRYLPGHGPHPFRSPEGHSYTDGQAPAHTPWTPGPTPLADPQWLWPMDLFDHRYFWEAHEAWEGLWHQLPRAAPRAQLTQGLIQVSAAVLKGVLGQERAARSLLAAARPRVRDGGWGVDGAALLEQTDGFLQGGPWPRL